jgi:hypothetical protein
VLAGQWDRKALCGHDHDTPVDLSCEEGDE